MLMQSTSAPTFCLPRVNSPTDESYQLTDLTATGPVLLVFCPVTSHPRSDLTWALCDLDWLQFLPGIRVAIVTPSDSQTVRDFVSETGVETLILSDTDETVSERYGLSTDESDEPESAIFLIDQAQTIQQRWTSQQSLATIDLTKVAADVKHHLNTADTCPNTTQPADHSRHHHSDSPGMTPLDVRECYSDRLHVTKVLGFGEAGTGVVVFTIESNSDGGVAVELTDRLRASVEQESVQCPVGEYTNWTIADETLVYETIIPAGGQIEIWYTVDIAEPTDLQRFDATPKVTSTSIADSQNQLEHTPENTSLLEATPMTDHNPTADTSETDEMSTDNSLLHDEQEASSWTDRPAETQAESTEPSGDDPISDEDTVTPGPPDRVSTSSDIDAESDSRTVVAALVRELEQETLSDHERDVLADHFGQKLADRDEPAVSGSVGARLRHVQTTVDDLDAYTTALGEFLDENGSVHELTSEIEDTRSAVDVVDADLAAVEDRLESVTARLDDLEAVMEQVERLDEQVNGVTQASKTLRDHHESMADRLTAIDDEFDSLRETVEHIQTFQEAMRTALDHGDPAKSVANADPAN